MFTHQLCSARTYGGGGTGGQVKVEGPGRTCGDTRCHTQLILTVPLVLLLTPQHFTPHHDSTPPPPPPQHHPPGQGRDLGEGYERGDLYRGQSRGVQLGQTYLREEEDGCGGEDGRGLRWYHLHKGILHVKVSR